MWEEAETFYTSYLARAPSPLTVYQYRLLSLLGIKWPDCSITIKMKLTYTSVLYEVTENKTLNDSLKVTQLPLRKAVPSTGLIAKPRSANGIHIAFRD